MITIFRNGFDLTPHYITMQQALDRIKSGKSKQIVDTLRAEPDKDSRNEIKLNLPSVVFAGKFEGRKDKTIEEHSGYVVLDFDHLDNLIELKQAIFKEPFILACWISPSGDGVKAIARIKHKDKHRGHYKSLIKHFEPLGVNPDPKNINEGRLCFESFDRELLQKDLAIEYELFENEKTYEAKQIILAETDEDKIYVKLKKWAENKGEVFVEGNRNNFLMKMASACNRTGISRDSAFGYLASDFLHGTTFSVRELQQILKSVYTNYANQHGVARFENSSIMNISTNEILDNKTFDCDLPVKDLIYFKDVSENMKERIKKGITKGETTYFPILDNHFRWMRREVSVVHGYGNHGKSTMSFQLMLFKSVFEGKKWCIFNPENSPADYFYQDIAEMYVGKQFDKTTYNPATDEEIEKAIDFVNGHFFYIFPENDLPTPEYILKRFVETIIKHKIDGVVIDPYNQLAHKNRTRRDDQYLEDVLADFKRFAQSHDVYFIICAHPHSPKRNGKSTVYDEPTVYELAGGAMWNNKPDNILCYNRPNFFTNPKDNWCTFSSQRIRKQKMNGIQGKVHYFYDRIKCRFYEQTKEPTQINIEGFVESQFESGYNPLDRADKIKTEKQYRDITISAKEQNDFDF